ncbi:MAG TPA: chemotaxis protein CheB [Actinoplanes sp.]|nr:chemotaxis protein CheB [Actinoplanes sp.]
MTHRDVVAVGASAGGVEALRALVAGLPSDLAAAVLVVLHMPREAPSALPQILDRSGPLPATVAVDGEELRPGHIYVAVADHHLLVLDHRVRLSHGPAENGHRPAIDPLFRSVARAAGPRAVAVVLSGARDDGAVGAAAVAARGGVTIVQDPEDALCGSMPRAAIARRRPDYVARAAEIGGLLSGLITMPLPEQLPTALGDARLDDEVAMSDFADITTDQLLTVPAGYGCPSCGGGLFELEQTPAPRYRCRIGHAWSPESLLDEQAVTTEGALWMALRALEEKSALSRRMASSRTGLSYGDRFDRMARDAEQAGALIRSLIERLAGDPRPARADQGAARDGVA